jgi:hypothetical protein
MIGGGAHFNQSMSQTGQNGSATIDLGLRSYATAHGARRMPRL